MGDASWGSVGKGSMESAPASIHEAAYQLGRAHKVRDMASGGTTWAPLSGEWAGQSIPEVFGGLWKFIGWEHPEFDTICDHYENGYFADPSEGGN